MAHDTSQDIEDVERGRLGRGYSTADRAVLHVV